MTWVKVDDQFQDHPKFLDVSLAAVGLWVAGLAYCSRYLTDGHIAAKAAKRLGGTKRLTDELEEAGLWHPTDGGWDVHDYLSYNPSADRVRDVREARAEAGKRGGVARGKQQQEEAKARQLAKQTPGNLSDKTQASRERLFSPRPVPSRSTEVSDLTSSSRLSSTGDDDERFASQALTDLGHLRHDRATASGKVNGNAPRHLAACVDNALAELGDAAVDWRRQHPDGTADQLIAALDPSFAAATNGHAQQARCGVCGSTDHAGAACLLEPEDRTAEP
jgi:hypothetical protein